MENNKRSEDLQTKDSTEDKRVFATEDIKEHEEGHTELPTKNIKGVSSLTQVNNDKTMETEANSNMIHASPPKRPSLIRRGTTLKRDGELYTDTETYSSYVAYEGQHKPGLARRPTSFKNGGRFRNDH